MTRLPGLVELTLDPRPGPAREWLREELSRPDYQPSLQQRFFEWVGDLFDGVRDASSAVGGFDPVLAVLVLGAVLVLAAVVLSRLRVDRSRPEGARALFTEARLTASEHRALAGAALGQEDWDTVVVESLRALAAGLVERGLVVEQAATTAHELAHRSADLFPGLADRLTGLASVFDETVYGDLAADSGRAHEALALEQAVSEARPVAGGARTPRLAVPR